MTKIFIGTPAFDGKVNVQYAVALAETRLMLATNGIDCMMRIHTSGSLLVRERNDLVKSFLRSDATHMLCIDSDIGWAAQSVKAMIEHCEPFVAALYPARGDKSFLFRGIYGEDGGMKMSEKRLIEMEYIPAGFMLIQRHVLEKMIEDTPHLYYEPKAESLKHASGHYLFATEIYEGEFWGEDYVFCRRARQSGFRIWVDPFVQIDHAGTVASFADILSDKNQEEQKKLDC